jgi:hypothetical protein
MHWDIGARNARYMQRSTLARNNHKPHIQLLSAIDFPYLLGVAHKKYL